MSADAEPAVVGPWAREKLQALGQYLDYFTKVLKNQGHWIQGTTFVDAFAGGGTAKIRRSAGADAASLLDQLDPPPVDEEAEEFVKGSPRVALELANPFSRYVFIERNSRRAAELADLSRSFGGQRSIEVRQGAADDEIAALVDSDLARPRHRAVVFLDPFGMQISWTTIERLAATKQVEVILNFTLGMAIQRLLVRSGDIPPSWRRTLDRFFGTSEWFEQVYETEHDLVGQVTKKVPQSGQRLLRWYCGRLEGAFGLVSTPRLIRNSHGAHLYHLIWAGPHPAGLKGAEYILGKGEQIGESRPSRRQPSAQGQLL